MRLNELKPAQGSRPGAKRVGRGPGSGSGKTAGRGMKGQKSRSGGYHKIGFEGGQMPIYRRTPKRGFTNIFAKKYEIVNIGRLQKAIDDKRLDVKGTINAETMTAAGLICNNRDGVRLLGQGELKAGVTIEVAGATKSAIAAVEKAGGKVILPEASKVELEAQEKSAKSKTKKATAASAPKKEKAGDAEAEEAEE